MEGEMGSQTKSDTMAYSSSSGAVLPRIWGHTSTGNHSGQSASCSYLSEADSGVQMDLVGAPAAASSEGHALQPDSLMLITEQSATAQSQTDIVESEDKATDPLLLWGTDGWKCQRCGKPPLA